jgi:hypothetical protein
MAIIISVISSAAKKQEEERKKHSNYPQRTPQTYMSRGETQEVVSSNEGDDTRRRQPVTAPTARLESTIKATKASVHSSKEVPDPDCEPHKPVKSMEGDSRYIIRQPKKPKTADEVPAPSILGEMSYDNNSLIKGIIYSEIYGKPKSRR